MRTFLAVAFVALFAVTFANPSSRRLEGGKLCTTCQELVAGGEGLGTQYTMACLTAEITALCDHTGLLSHKCKVYFDADAAAIDQKIQAMEQASYACVDLNFR